MANKSLFKAFSLLLASSLSFLVLSCSMDLEPAWKKGTTLTIEMGAPTAEQSRALLTQSGFLYIVPGTKILGPYAVSAGARFSTTDVNPGTYASFILVYSSYKIDPEILQSALDGDESFIDSLTRDVSGRVSYGALRDVTIKPSMDNVVAATLVPAVSSGLIIDPVEFCLEVPVNPEEGEISVSRFIKINNPLTPVVSKVTGIQFSINATTTDGGFLPQANLPTVIPVYAPDGKASSTFIRKNYTDGIATYTGPLPAVKDTLYISVSFTPDKNRSAIHVSLVQRIDTTVAVSVTITNPDSPVFAFSGPAATVYTVPIEVSVMDETDSDLSNTYAWKLNGVDTGVSSSGIMLDFVNGVGKDSYMIGMNTLSLIVGKTVDGVTNYYSDSYSFEVTEPITP